jgi:predicted dehydrogenase
MPGERPRVALVGCGRWGAHILRDLRTLGAGVVVVARSEASVARARDGGADAVVEDIAALPEVDGAVVATPTATHAEVIDEVRAAQDVPVYVEKPLAPDPAAAQRLAEAHAGKLFVMDKWRYHAGVREIARIARSGELGAVTGLHTRRVTLGHRHADVDTVWIHAPHDLAIVLEVLGELPPAVHATEERVRGERVGMTATLGGPPWATFEISCVAPDHRRELRLLCEDGFALMDGGWATEVRVVRQIMGDPQVEVRPTPGELPLLAELRAFVEHLEGGPPPLSDAATAAEAVTRIDELGRLARSVTAAT